MFEEIRDPEDRVRAVCRFGCQVSVDDSLPPRMYFRSGNEMLRMANVYHSEGDFESAFILYSKFISIFVEKLPRHPEYKSATAADKACNKQKVGEIFPKAEELKKKLLLKYVVEEENRRKEEKKQLEERARRQEKQRQKEEHRRLELEQLAEHEGKRRHELEEQMRLEQEEQFRLLQEYEKNKQNENERRAAGAAAAAAAAAAGGVTIATNIPDQPPSYDSSIASGGMPGILVTPSAPGAGPPAVDRSTKPMSHFTNSGVSTGNKYGLRDLQVPADVMMKFLNAALSNTTKNIETLAVLCGKLAHNVFHITHVVLPKQKGTHDSCDPENEEELVMFQDQNDLIMLGWIHTHPQYNAFLSSVDLHIHCWYQKMLPEAIAIVCSPKFQETGFLALTPEYGLDYIAKCKQKGFHKHATDLPLFESCDHVKVDANSTATLVDLRR